MCERLVQDRCPAMQRPGIEPATCWSQVQRYNQYATEPLIQRIHLSVAVQRTAASDQRSS